MENIVVTGGAGFIGANFILGWIGATHEGVVANIDKLTYAGNLHNLDDLQGNPRHVFCQGDINDKDFVAGVLARYRPRAIVHFAAESHVDRSIYGPEEFVTTNVMGTMRLLEATRAYWTGLAPSNKQAFRFLHVSTDEVYGSLEPQDPPFSETSAYAPNSPYAASKASSDHIVRAFNRTYGLPVLTTNCSNNYGPYQFPEKLIPLLIFNAIRGRSLPLYGDGLHIRDWLYVDDHCAAIRAVLAHGRVGETYNIGGNAERTNREIAQAVCTSLDEMHPESAKPRHDALITFVEDRLGHDRRYAIDATKIRQELEWHPQESFESGLRKTVSWYLSHMKWTEDVTSGHYRQWVDRHYTGRPT